MAKIPKQGAGMTHGAPEMQAEDHQPRERRQAQQGFPDDRRRPKEARGLAPGEADTAEAQRDRKKRQRQMHEPGDGCSNINHGHVLCNAGFTAGL